MELLTNLALLLNTNVILYQSKTDYFTVSMDKKFSLRGSYSVFESYFPEATLVDRNNFGLILFFLPTPGFVFFW